MKKPLCLLTALVLICACLPALAEDFVWGQDPLCFDGTPDFAYDDSSSPNGHLKINIKKFEDGTKLVYYVCDIQVSSPDALLTAFYNDKKVSATGLMEDIAQANGAVLAVNCDFCGDHTSGVIIRNGKLYRANKTNKLDMLIIDKNGDFSLHYDRSKDDPQQLAQELLDKGVMQTIEFGPALVENGQALPLDNKTHVISTRSTQLEPRTAIGQIGKLHYIIIMVEGRREGYSDGISLQGLQQLFLQYGAQTAINLDGGGSAKLYFYNQVINRPSSPTRQVSDALIFK